MSEQNECIQQVMEELTRIRELGVEDEEEYNALIREFMAVSGGMGAELLTGEQQQESDLQVAIAVAVDEELKHDMEKPTPDADDTDYECELRKETNFMGNDDS